jgi:glutamate transport system substrate-binding protein
MRCRCAVLAAATVLIASAGCSSPPKEPDPRRYLTGTVPVGVNVDLPGWSDYPNGTWLGFDIDLANFVKREIGFEIEFIPVTTEERLTKLVEASQTDKPGIKMVVSNMSMTADRRTKIDLAGPYFDDKQGALTLADSPLRATSQLKDQRVCVSLGSTNSFRLPEWDAVGIPERTMKKCIESLRQGNVDAVSSDQAILESFVNSQRGLRMLNGPIGSERYGIGIPNNRPKLCQLLSEVIRKFIDTRWDQAFSANLAGLSDKDRKPNSNALTPCDMPNALSMPKLHSTLRQPALRSTTRGRRPRRQKTSLSLSGQPVLP